MKILTASIPLWLMLVVVAAVGFASATGSRALWRDDDQPSTQVAAPPTAILMTSPSADEIRQKEYAVLSKLRGGMALAYFQDLLGVPQFVTRGAKGPFTQSLFRGHDYWLQAVSDDAGAVQLMAVTACDPDFHPSFDAQSGFSGFGNLTLNETRLNQTNAAPRTLRYFTGVTANSYYYDEYYLGNPANYKTYFVGINDACGRPPPDVLQPLVAAHYEDRPYDSADTVVAKFREAAIANTYAETGPFFDDTVLNSFQVGAGRILTRTAPPPPP